LVVTEDCWRLALVLLPLPLFASFGRRIQYATHCYTHRLWFTCYRLLPLPAHGWIICLTVPDVTLVEGSHYTTQLFPPRTPHTATTTGFFPACHTVATRHRLHHTTYPRWDRADTPRRCRACILPSHTLPGGTFLPLHWDQHFGLVSDVPTSTTTVYPFITPPHLHILNGSMDFSSS